jgi:hypothetical protein
MKTIKRPLLMILLFSAIVVLVACGSEVAPDEEEPARVEKVEGSEFNKVTLTARAAERLDIQSEAVREVESDSGMLMVVPYSAILYGLNGETWAYVRNPGGDSLVFVRQPITVDHIEGGLAFLTDGPPAGTEVVSVGAALLYGADTGVGK